MELVNGLPEKCFGENPATGEIIVVKRGEMGYYQTEFEDTRTAREMNSILGITEAQEMAMLTGSMFGWDVPGADPVAWEGVEKVNTEEKHGVICPKCKENTLHPKQVRNSLSRRDNETYICNDCGTAEAMEDWAKVKN